MPLLSGYPGNAYPDGGGAEQLLAVGIQGKASVYNRIETTSDNIDEITLQVGYHDTRTFRRLFKQYTSLSPREYRDKFSVV